MLMVMLMSQVCVPDFKAFGYDFADSFAFAEAFADTYADANGDADASSDADDDGNGDAGVSGVRPRSKAFGEEETSCQPCHQVIWEEQAIS